MPLALRHSASLTILLPLGIGDFGTGLCGPFKRVAQEPDQGGLAVCLLLGYNGPKSQIPASLDNLNERHLPGL